VLSLGYGTVLRAILICALCTFSLVLAASALLACGPATGRPVGQPRVLTTTTILADLVRQLAGDAVSVESIAPAGATIEDFAPRPEDSRRASEAKLIVMNGLGLDRWVEPLLRNRASDAMVLAVGEGLPAIVEEGTGNPHFWFDVTFAKRYVERIRDALAEIDPSRASRYGENAARYLRELDELDREIRARVSTLPAERRRLVTSHDAFPYFAEAYGFEVVGFVQSEPGKDPSAAELAELVEKVRTAQVPAVFVEAGHSPALAQALADEASVRRVVTDLPTDSLGPPPTDTYVGLMRTLIQKIVDALR
jgi:ABC-type Zn uptake system ZnuABC Zn-binding protein ZnuA